MVFCRLKKYAPIFVVLLLIIPVFQNCSQKIQTSASLIDNVKAKHGNLHLLSLADRNLTLLDPALIEVERKETVGVMFRADYQSLCPQLSVKADLYLIGSNGSLEFQNRCFAVAASTPSDFQKVGYCFFRKPRPVGDNADKLFLRLWKGTSDCLSYADEAGEVAGGFKDFPLSGRINKTDSYRAFGDNRLISIDKTFYSLKMDRHGGATYEFYNKRAHRDGKSFLSNALHSHSGAAVQVAVHDHTSPKINLGSCDSSQGYWNPTQAGFHCSHSGGVNNEIPDAPSPGALSGLEITCDGAINNNCSSATQRVQFSKHRMFNWDYGPNYKGPYNDKDLAYLSQDVMAFETYVSYDITFENRFQAFRGPIEIPAFYFTNNFRKYHFQKSGVLETVTIPEHRSDKVNYATPDNATEINWISFENTSGTLADNYTIAWFYSDEFRADISMAGYGVKEQHAFNSIKFGNGPIMNFKTNKVYRFRYVVFPFLFSEVIDSKYGRLAVKDVITKMQSEYSVTAAAPATPPTPVAVIEKPLNFQAVTAPNQLWSANLAIDGNAGTIFSSNFSTSSTPSSDMFLHAHYTDGPRQVSGVVLTARMFNGRALGFPKRYKVLVPNSTDSGWELVAETNFQPNAHGEVYIGFAARSVTGVLVVPLELGVDNENNHYFQLAEIIFRK